MRGHQRCGLEREWGIVYTDEVLGEMSSYKDPMAGGTGAGGSPRAMQDLYRIPLLSHPSLISPLIDMAQIRSQEWSRYGARSGVLSQSYSLH